MAVLLPIDELVRQLTEAEAMIIDANDLRRALESQIEYWQHKHVFEYEKLAVALRELPLDDTALQAIEIICRVLKEQNPRFDPGLFSEWVLEGK